MGPSASMTWWVWSVGSRVQREVCHRVKGKREQNLACSPDSPFSHLSLSSTVHLPDHCGGRGPQPMASGNGYPPLKGKCGRLSVEIV